MPNNRELATAFWMTAFGVWALSRPDVRHAVLDVLTVARAPKLSVPFLLLGGNLIGLCVLGTSAGAWDRGLITGTVVWLIVSGGVTFVNLNAASRDRHFFRRVALATLQYSVGVEFILTLFVLSLPLELILQPVVGTLTVLSVAAAREQRYVRVKGVVDGAMAIIGISLVGFAVFQLATNWQALDFRGLSRSFVLPIWLTLGSIPLFYLMSLYMTYEVAFVRLGFHSGDVPVSRRAKLAMLLRFNVRLREVGRIHGVWWGHLAQARSFRGTWRTIGEFHRSADDSDIASR